MSDDRTDAELSTALHRFAAEHEAFPALTGAEVRGRAVRRAHRRVAGTLVAGTAALALVAFALTLDFTDFTDSAEEGKQRQVPAAPPVVPSASAPSAAASSPTRPALVTGSVDLGKRILIVGKRVLPMTKGSPNTLKFAGPLTVHDKKPDVKTLTVANPTDGSRYNVEISYVVELRDADNVPVYVGAALHFDKANAGKYQDSSGWIDLDASDAKWFYTTVKNGTALSVTGYP
nr:hypothetical protein OG999_25575 [Streptomyces sp. NBC_00886]